jgi:hypothetical protein
LDKGRGVRETIEGQAGRNDEGNDETVENAEEVPRFTPVSGEKFRGPHRQTGAQTGQPV